MAPWGAAVGGVGYRQAVGRGDVVIGIHGERERGHRQGGRHRQHHPPLLLGHKVLSEMDQGQQDTLHIALFDGQELPGPVVGELACGAIGALPPGQPVDPIPGRLFTEYKCSSAY